MVYLFSGAAEALFAKVGYGFEPGFVGLGFLAALGTYYVHGRFVPQDIGQARSLFKAAAQKGNETASLFLKILDETLANQ